MAAYEQSGEKWRAYYELVSGRPVRDFIYDAVQRFEAPGRAVDLGCGAGNEARYLLSRGWCVLAIDRQPEALDFLKTGLSAGDRARLDTRVAPFEGLEIPPADFIWAGFSLPFCPPGYFARLWEAIVAALKPGGRFAGDFFGEQHAWIKTKDMTFHTRAQVLALCEPLYLEYLREEEGEQITAADGIQHFHIFSVRVRKE